MFDSVTSALIAASPDLENIDRQRLPELITDAYLQIKSAQAWPSNNAPTDNSAINTIKSIGATQEAIALSIDDENLRTSAAYVAASAYKLIDTLNDQRDNSLAQSGPESISAKVSATLLYISADAIADAAEIAQTIRPSDNASLQPLLENLKLLSGASKITSNDFTNIAIDPSLPPNKLGPLLGFYKLNKTLIELLNNVYNENHITRWTPGSFSTIAAEMSSTVNFQIDGLPHSTQNLFAGPWHLGRLLDLAEATVIRASTASIEAPSDLDSTKWKPVIRTVSRKRPLLWPNHLDALNSGLLELGTSAVLAFPTGAGKSTLSELKVAATIMRGKSAICLAPTLALVDQLSRSFHKLVPETRTVSELDFDLAIDSDDSITPSIYVMTPESCLTAINHDHNQFGEIGLVVFDEAHLMHSEHGAPSRRAIDATLCFLTLISRFPVADLLLISAMFSNAGDISKWLSSITGKPALSLANPWKPTRQAKGVVVYDTNEIEELRRLVKTSFENTTQKTPPADLKRRMRARAFGLFSLRATWDTMQSRDYKLLPLLEDSVNLSVGGQRARDGSWWLTPNSNKVAARFASSAAMSGIKTLIFAPQTSWAISASKEVNSSNTKRTVLNEDEREMLRIIEDELGESTATYLQVENGVAIGGSIPHHGLLLKNERRLHESLYRRNDGVPVMVATSTVTQGMNFPSEIVVISSDQRFDPETNARTRMQAHELLNAAGRAGRAGAHANAMVIVIPGSIIHYDGVSRIGTAWSPLREVFSNSDQCVELVDPLEQILENFDVEEYSNVREYLLRRLDSSEESEVGPSMLRRSFAAYTRRTAGSPNWIDSRLARVETAIASQTVPEWIRQCALVTGLTYGDLDYIASKLDELSGTFEHLDEWIEWIFLLMLDRPSIADGILRTGGRAAVAGTTDELDSWAYSVETLVARLQILLPPWLSGSSLSEIQRLGVELGIAKDTDIKLSFARKFALRVIPDLSYVFSVPGIIQSVRLQQYGSESFESHPLSFIGQCVELGVDTKHKIDLVNKTRGATRRSVRDA